MTSRAALPLVNCKTSHLKALTYTEEHSTVGNTELRIMLIGVEDCGQTLSSYKDGNNLAS